jgi:hypothetical protein
VPQAEYMTHITTASSGTISRPAPARRPEPARPRRKAAILAIVLVGQFMAVLDNNATSVN